jgi:hypothetical protein
MQLDVRAMLDQRRKDVEIFPLRRELDELAMSRHSLCCAPTSVQAGGLAGGSRARADICRPMGAVQCN